MTTQLCCWTLRVSCAVRVSSVL